MEPEQKPEKPWFLDAAFVVPLSIFIVYFWSLSLMIGVYSHFNIPYDFISLNPTNVLAISRPPLAVIAFYLIFILFGISIADIIEKNPRVGLFI